MQYFVFPKAEYPVTDMPKVLSSEEKTLLTNYHVKQVSFNHVACTVPIVVPLMATDKYEETLKLLVFYLHIVFHF